jgi:hypothetical protein
VLYQTELHSDLLLYSNINDLFWQMEPNVASYICELPTYQ